ncbi:hypothetical protein ACL58G_17180 [Massilia sp. GER05]|uniref:hypothetical protein n=1 Tax=Massilia sp. GER05 TaxID=3394605 RepID=UPI003F8506C9
MKKLCFTILLCTVVSVCHSENAKRPIDAQQKVLLDERGSDYYSYHTGLGTLEFLDRSGERGTPAIKILLNGKAIVNLEGVTDKGGSEQSLMLDSFTNVIDWASSKGNQSGPSDVKRMIVSVGATSNCVRRYIMLDFTDTKPFVSKPFSYNPDDDICEHLKKVKWGKQETFIDLAGPQRYLYRPQREVIGPIGD